MNKIAITITTGVLGLCAQGFAATTGPEVSSFAK